MILVRRRAKTHKVINNLCAFGEYCIIPCIDTVLRPKLAQYRPKGEWVRGGCFKFAHGEWIYVCHINWFGYLCEHTFVLIPFTTLEIISKNFRTSKLTRADKPGLPLVLSENSPIGYHYLAS